jgi:hypothetical protein
MSKTRIGVAAVVCCAVAVASGVFAQDRRAERRERLRSAAEAAAGVVADRIEDAVEGGDVVGGDVIMLQGQPAIEAKEVNKGGLIVVRVADSGSRPPQDIKVEHGRQYQRLGQVRGVRERDGRPQMGGGYTWVLLKPVSEGPGAIVLSYTPNDGGAPVKREFKVNVTAAEADDTGR